MEPLLWKAEEVHIENKYIAFYMNIYFFISSYCSGNGRSTGQLLPPNPWTDNLHHGLRHSGDQGHHQQAERINLQNK